MSSRISKIAIITVLLGMLIIILGFIFSIGYERQKGLLGNLSSMNVVLSERKMLPYFAKVEQGKENTNSETIEVKNDDKSKAVYEFPEGSSLDTQRAAIKARYENKRGGKVIFNGRFRFVEWYTSEDEISIKYRFVLGLGILLVFAGAATRILFERKT